MSEVPMQISGLPTSIENTVHSKVKVSTSVETVGVCWDFRQSELPMYVRISDNSDKQASQGSRRQDSRPESGLSTATVTAQAK
jgi:hypothetical protein